MNVHKMYSRRDVFNWVLFGMSLFFRNGFKVFFIQKTPFAIEHFILINRTAAYCYYNTDMQSRPHRYRLLIARLSFSVLARRLS